jgi:hypothetical protein
MRYTRATMMQCKRSASVWLILGTFGLSSTALGQEIRVEEFRPARIGAGSLLIKGIHHFHAPHVYEVALDSKTVDQVLPSPIEPRLQRPPAKFMDRVSAAFRTPLFIRTIHKILRRVETTSDITSREELRDHFEDFNTHTYAITGSGFAFAETGPRFGQDLVSKHAIIAEDFRDVRYAGQFWRDGNKLCFNSNSGTYIKKRKSGDLDPAPDYQAAMTVIKAVFEPALKVEYCREIAPWFGANEAIDQAQKAIAAAIDAETLADTAGKSAEVVAKAWDLAGKARAKADLAYDAASAASQAEGAYAQTPEDAVVRAHFFELDLKAAEAAADAKKARKKIEKLTNPARDDAE